MVPVVKTIDAARLADLSAEAQAAPRLRKNLNLHETLEDPIQRLLNALEPDTYIRPHRHPDGVWEVFVLLSGACTLLVFDEDGTVTERVELGQSGIRIAEIPAGCWHGVVSRTRGTVVMETKPGPYVPGRFAPWSPEEGQPEAAILLDWARSAEVGERFAHG